METFLLDEIDALANEFDAVVLKRGNQAAGFMSQTGCKVHETEIPLALYFEFS
jgi:hypothetical protein